METCPSLSWNKHVWGFFHLKHSLHSDFYRWRHCTLKSYFHEFSLKTCILYKNTIWDMNHLYKLLIFFSDSSKHQLNLCCFVLVLGIRQCKAWPWQQRRRWVGFLISQITVICSWPSRPVRRLLRKFTGTLVGLWSRSRITENIYCLGDVLNILKLSLFVRGNSSSKKTQFFVFFIVNGSIKIPIKADKFAWHIPWFCQ